MHCLRCVGGAVGVSWRYRRSAQKVKCCYVLDVQLGCTGGAIKMHWRCSRVCWRCTGGMVGHRLDYYFLYNV